MPAHGDIRALAQELADREGYELVEATLSPAGRRRHLRVLIYRPGGVSLEDCRHFSEALAAIIDVEEAVRGSYVLEVSSPGLTRPLKTRADFQRAVGREVEVDTVGPDGQASKTTGTVTGTGDEGLGLDVGGSPLTIPWEGVRGARPVIDWRQLFRSGERRLRPGEGDHE
jgi:ribosome maturation factor RimP